jgi:hypothetical protein
MSQWQSEEQQVKLSMEALKESKTDCALNAQRTLELAHVAYSLYLTQKPAEQAELLKKVLLNCSIDAVSVTPTYRKPFDMIFERAKNKEWSGREDLNLRPPGPEFENDSKFFDINQHQRCSAVTLLLSPLFPAGRSQSFSYWRPQLAPQRYTHISPPQPCRKLTKLRAMKLPMRPTDRRGQLSGEIGTAEISAAR